MADSEIVVLDAMFQRSPGQNATCSRPIWSITARRTDMFVLEERLSVFDRRGIVTAGLVDFVYLPKDKSVTIRSHDKGDHSLCHGSASAGGAGVSAAKESSVLTATNLSAAFDRIVDYWSPKVIGKVNNQLLKIAKLKGELVWHAHDGEDELFYIVKGELRIEFEDGATLLREGDFLTVPRGVRHNPVAEAECWILLIEPGSTLHTGAEITDRTRSLDEQLR
ncbi:cupin domain-containing protein [Bradyrhizobium sp. USDA 4353]